MSKKGNEARPKHKKQYKRQHKLGKSPGTVIYMGNKDMADSEVSIIEYNPTLHKTYTPGNIEEVGLHKVPQTISWIDVTGLSDVAFIDRIGKHFDLNPLIREDIASTGQRAKLDEYEDYIFGVFKMLYLDEASEVVCEHVAIVLMEHCVLVFQEMEKDVFEGVRERVANEHGRIRGKGADYLFFALLDAIIDNYFVVLENINHKIELLEEEVYDRPVPQIAHDIQDLKKEVLKIRQWVYPVKELISRLIDTESKLVSKDTKVFLRDALDHSVEINENIQIYREMTMSLMEMYMSNMSNKMNEVMKVLTIMASIFIPLTFIVGVYGMNFDHMPELHWKHGYPMVWGVMVLTFIGMLIYFKKKRWL